MDTPRITINEKTFEPSPPTMQVWRRTVDFVNADKAQWTIDELGQRYLSYIVHAFNRPEVTAEGVENALLACDLIPTGAALANWVYLQIIPRLDKLPNGATPPGD